MTRDRLLRIGSATGYGIGLAALIILLQHDGGYAYDARSYWLAGRHVLDGQPLYERVAIDAVLPQAHEPLFREARDRVRPEAPRREHRRREAGRRTRQQFEDLQLFRGQ